MDEKGIKVRYKPEDYKKLKEKADRLKMSVNEYQKMISKRAKVKVEIEDEITKEDIKKIKDFSKFCKKKKLRIYFQSNGITQVVHQTPEPIIDEKWLFKEIEKIDKNE